jgi:ubiquitin-like 1-activating enzyme E1 B
LSRQADIKDAKFDLNYFKNFNLVLNALDNMGNRVILNYKLLNLTCSFLDARRHVNKMCLQANVPLIESGSAGYLGQVTLIKKVKPDYYIFINPLILIFYRVFQNVTTVNLSNHQKPILFAQSVALQVFQFIALSGLKVIYSSLLQNNYTLSILIFIKFLFSQLFGDDSEEQSNVIDTNQNSENREEIEKLQTEAQALKRLRDSMDNGEFSRNVFNKVFKDDISRLTSIPEMWKTRDPPKPLDLEEILTEDKVNGEVHNNNVEKAKMDSWQKILSLKETTKVFLSR